MIQLRIGVKRLRELPHRVVSRLISRLKAETARHAMEEVAAGKGQGLLRLHEYQHRVIVDIFKTSIAGFFAFALILLSFTLHTLVDSHSPRWIAYLMGALALLLMAGLFRTVQEFRTYRDNYEEITVQLRAKLAQQTARPAAAPTPKGGKGIEQRLLSTLKPKEYRGWDAKACKNCGRAMELLATVCPSCGHDQAVLLVN